MGKKNNKDNLKNYKHDYNLKNKEKIKSNFELWKNNNKDRINKYYSLKRKDPLYKIAHNLRSRLYDFLKGKIKHKNTEALTGCYYEELLKHLESLFQLGMSWDNYGKEWSIDHIVPLCRFNLEEPEELEKACHYTNLRPLWIRDNASKASLDKIKVNIKQI